MISPTHVISATDNSNTEAGSTKQLAQLAHQVSLLDEKIHAARQQQQHHAESSDKVRIITLMSDL